MAWTTSVSFATDKQVSLQDDITLPDSSHDPSEQSRGFGFLRFSNLQQAESFMDKHYPFLYLYGDYDKSPGVCKVRLAFGRERKEVPRPDEDDWICSMVS